MSPAGICPPLGGAISYVPPMSRFTRAYKNQKIANAIMYGSATFRASKPPSKIAWPTSPPNAVELAIYASISFQLILIVLFHFTLLPKSRKDPEKNAEDNTEHYADCQ
jgi:hypothetical protein